MPRLEDAIFVLPGGGDKKSHQLLCITAVAFSLKSQNVTTDQLISCRKLCEDRKLLRHWVSLILIIYTSEREIHPDATR